MKEGRGVGGGMWGDYIYLKGVAGERKGNVQALRLWDTLPTCLGWQNQCHLLKSHLTGFSYAQQQDQNLLHIGNCINL